MSAEFGRNSEFVEEVKSLDNLLNPVGEDPVADIRVLVENWDTDDWNDVDIIGFAKLTSDGALSKTLDMVRQYVDFVADNPEHASHDRFLALGKLQPETLKAVLDLAPRVLE